MRQICVAALLTLSLLLAGCSAAGDETRIDAIRQRLEASSVDCEAEITAGIGEETETFTLSCTESAQGTLVTVLSPELLSGVTARPGPDGELRFDGLVVPLREVGAVSALSALPKTLEILRTAHLDLVWREGDTLTAQFLPEDDLALRAYFTPEDALSSAEFIADGKTAVRFRVTKWNLKQNEEEEPYESDDPNLGGDQSQHPGA